MLAGKQAKARRGALAIPLPTGYVRRPSGEAALDPDEQVQTVVRLIFSKFAELGTLHGVLRWMVDHGVELGMRLHAGPDKGELVWGRPNRMTLQNMLHSPIYAGIYAYGRRRVDPRRQLPGRPSTGRVVREQDEWLVAIPAVLPAYITIGAYHANLARLAANAARAVTSCLRATRAWYPACFGRWPLPIVGTSGLVLGRGIGRLPGSSVRVSDPGAAPLSRLAGVRHVRSPRFPTATVAESAAAG
jgi:Recombinase